MNPEKRQTKEEEPYAIQRLIALKRYEQPDPFFETRSLARLREALAHTAPGMSWGARMMEWITEHPAVLLPAAAAVALTLWGGHLWRDPAAPEVRQNAPLMAEIAPEPVDESPALAADDTGGENELYRKPVFVFESTSNREPKGPLRMGPSSVPVRYDF